jgi:hypothetical protein
MIIPITKRIDLIELSFKLEFYIINLNTIIDYPNVLFYPPIAALVLTAISKGPILSYFYEINIIRPFFSASTTPQKRIPTVAESHQSLPDEVPMSP